MTCGNGYVQCSDGVKALIAAEQDRRPPIELDWSQVEAILRQQRPEMAVVHGIHRHPPMTQGDVAVSWQESTKTVREPIGWQSWLTGKRAEMVRMADALVFHRETFRAIINQHVTSSTADFPRMLIGASVTFISEEVVRGYGDSGTLQRELEREILRAHNLTWNMSVEYDQPVAVLRYPAVDQVITQLFLFDERQSIVDQFTEAVDRAISRTSRGLKLQLGS